MLRITALSLLLGAATLIAALTQFLPPQHSSQQNAPAIVWNPSNANVLYGIPTKKADELHLELSNKGGGRLSLGAASFKANDFSFIHLALEQSAEDMSATLVWGSDSDEQDFHSYQLENRSRQSLWLSTDELRGWDGEITTLDLKFSGRAGDTVLIRDFSVYPSSATGQLRAVYSDLTGYAPWNTAAMNTYTGVFNVSSFYPLALAVALLTCSLFFYAVLLLLLRTKINFNPSVVALIFLSTWIILDLFWQNRLLNQLVDTHRIFSGKTSEEKLAVGPDAELFGFVSRTTPLLETKRSRIFVASSDKYLAMRAAYYFYPLNVYWSLHSPVLPHSKFLRKGDYVVLISPSPSKFDTQQNRVIAPGRDDLEAELVFSDSLGTVVRLK